MQGPATPYNGTSGGYPNHPNGRNPYAHVALKVKNNFGKSYKDLPDDKINEVTTYLNFIKNTEGKKN